VNIYENGEISEVSVEDYTLRVLLAEGEGLPTETKKALAVSIRSTALCASEYGIKHTDYSFCSDKNCCMPLADAEKCSSAYYEECKAAVDATYALALTHGRDVALALFTRCAGSGTRKSRDIPYLTAVTNPEKCEIHIEEKRLPLSILGYNATEESCIVYTDNKKCDFGIFGGRAISSDELISILDVYSPEVTINYDDAEILVSSCGVGHCYGLDICGSVRMEKKNYDFEEILKNYFPELELKKLYR
jgi:peptidoglycan hydrolase-like amidase